MFGWSKDHKLIEVSFFEARESAPFARSALPVEQLPDTFEIETTLHIGGEDWMVQEASPRTKAEFRKTGKVALRLYKPKIGTVPVSDILYSLPTISNDFPNLVDATSLENVFVAHEDDWRQVEVISKRQTELIAKEMASIEALIRTQRVGPGFKSTHVRKLIPDPLPAGYLPLHELKSQVGVAHEFEGVAFSSRAAVVVGGFAFQAKDGTMFWGQVRQDGSLAALCLSSRDRAAPSVALKGTLKRRDLVFVDWVHQQTIPGEN